MFGKRLRSVDFSLSLSFSRYLFLSLTLSVSRISEISRLDADGFAAPMDLGRWREETRVICKRCAVCLALPFLRRVVSEQRT